MHSNSVLNDDSTVLALDIQNLQKIYKNQVHALKNVSLQIEQGDFYALLGANGAGKSTLIGILTGLVTKTQGIVKVFGLDLDKQTSEIKVMIGVVPQELNFSIFERVLDIVVNQAGYYGISPGVAKKRAVELLERLGLKEKMFQQAKNLSGGMKRRLMIARALVHEPKFLILDEPTAGVDIELRIETWNYFKELNKQGLTILLTTHYLEEVEQLCNKASIIKDGQIIKQDTIKNIINSVSKDQYILDLSLDITKESALIEVLKEFKVKILSTREVEITIEKNKQTLNQVFQKVNNLNCQILAIKAKNNKLENYFLNILDEK